MSARKVQGTCYCKGVSFEADLPTRFVAHCHCHNCRRAHTAGFVTWAGFPEEQVRLLAGEDQLTRYVTDTQATRSFCSVCGSTVFFQGPRWEGEIHVAVGALDDALDDLPKVHAYADRSPDWCPINDDLPRYGGETGIEPLGEDS